MSVAKDRPRRRGRPQGDEVKTAILNAANELLEEEGFSGFTIEAVAARAGAARSTIYRWWPTRGALAMAGLLSATVPKIPYKWTTSPLSDMKQQMMLVADVYSGKVGRIISAIVAQGQGDPNTLKALIDGFVRPRRNEAKLVLMRAIECGELRKDIDLEIVVDTLYGPIWYRMLVPHAPLSPRWAAKLADQVFRGIRPK
jgi:AcrR family transcriptional regulator